MVIEHTEHPGGILYIYVSMVPLWEPSCFIQSIVSLNTIHATSSSILSVRCVLLTYTLPVPACIISPHITLRETSLEEQPPLQQAEK